MYERLENEVLRDRYARIKTSRDMLLLGIKLFLCGVIDTKELQERAEQADKEAL